MADSKSLTALLHTTQLIGEVTVACSESTARALCRPSRQLPSPFSTDEHPLPESPAFGEAVVSLRTVPSANLVADSKPVRVSLSTVLRPPSSMPDVEYAGAAQLTDGGLRRVRRMPNAARQALFAHIATNCSSGSVAVLGEGGSSAAALASSIATASATPPVLPGQGNVADHLVDAAARRDAAAVHKEDDVAERGAGDPLLLPASATSPAHRPASFDDVASVAARLHVPGPHLQ